MTYYICTKLHYVTKCNYFMYNISSSWILTIHKCKKMQNAKCGGRLLLVVVVLLLWQGLNPIHPGRVEQPYLYTSICQTPLPHGSTTLYFLATVLSKFHVAVLDQQWPISAKTLSSSNNVLIWIIGKTIQCYEVRMMDDHLILTWFPVFNSSLVLYWRLTRCPKRERTPPESWSGKAETAKVLQFPLFTKNIWLLALSAF